MKPLFLSFLIVIIFDSSIFAKDDKKVSFPNAEIVNEHTARIPFKLIDNLIVVQAELYNKSGNFIIDTGSETLILNKVHFNNGKVKSETTSGVNSEVDIVLEKHLKEFKLNHFSLKNTKSDIIDLSHIEDAKKMNLLGVIGYNILKDYEVFIDLYLNQITLTKTDRYGIKLDKNVYLEKITDSLSFQLKKHTIIIDAFFENKKFKFGLDSAAEFNQLNKNIDKAVLKNFKPQRRLKLTGASKRKVEVLAGKLYRVKLSETIYFGPMQTVITNLNKMNEVFGAHLDGIFGYEFLRQKRTIINYKTKKMYFINTPIGR